MPSTIFSTVDTKNIMSAEQIAITKKEDDGSALALVRNAIQTEIARLESKHQFYSSMSKRFTLCIAGFSATTTLLIAMSRVTTSEPVSSMLIAGSLITSATLPVIAAWDSWLRTREMWILKADYLRRFRRLEMDIELELRATDASITHEKVLRFHERFEALKEDDHEQWRRTRESPSRTIERSQAPPEAR